MIRNIAVLVVAGILLCASACTEDNDYGSIIQPPTNNEISSLWRGTYSGTCRLTSYGSGYVTRAIELRILDMGDNTVQVRAYLVPDFIESESSNCQGEVVETGRCQIRRLVEDTWYLCTLNRAGRFITGNMQTYQEGHAGQPNWLINSIDVVLEP